MERLSAAPVEGRAPEGGARRAYEIVADTLATHGVQDVFGLLGSANMELSVALAARIDVHCANHEAAAVAMADGYARSTRRLGVCTLTQGPGLTNAATPLVEAVKGHSPLVVLAGDTATDGQHHNQDLDQERFLAALDVGVRRLGSASTAAKDVVEACVAARHEQRPVAVLLPIDVQRQRGSPDPTTPPVVPAATAAGHDAVAAAVDLIDRASRPVIVVGRGADPSARSVFEDLATRIGALLATTIAAKGFFAGSPFDVGVCGGFATRVGGELLRTADLVLAFGASLNPWTTKRGTLFSRDTVIVQCDVDASALGALTSVSLGLVGDAGRTAGALIEELRGKQLGERAGLRTADVAEQLRSYDPWSDVDAATADAAADLDPRALMIRLDELLPANRQVAVDSGHFHGFPARYLSAGGVDSFVFAQAFQSVGLGIATGVGLSRGRPGRPTVVVIGDGGLAMSMGELDVVARSRLPLMVVVMDDGGYGAEVHHLDQLGLPSDIVRFGQRDFAAVARALRIDAHTARSLDDLEVVNGWSPEKGPMLLDCKVDANVVADWFVDAFHPTGA